MFISGFPTLRATQGWAFSATSQPGLGAAQQWVAGCACVHPHVQCLRGMAIAVRAHVCAFRCVQRLLPSDPCWNICEQLWVCSARAAACARVGLCMLLRAAVSWLVLLCAVRVCKCWCVSGVCSECWWWARSWMQWSLWVSSNSGNSMSPCVRIGACGHTHTDSVSSTAAVCTSSTGRVHKEECTQSYVRTQVYLQLHVQNHACRCVCSSVCTLALTYTYSLQYCTTPCRAIPHCALSCRAMPCQSWVWKCVCRCMCVYMCALMCKQS